MRECLTVLNAADVSCGMYTEYWPVGSAVWGSLWHAVQWHRKSIWLEWVKKNRDTYWILNIYTTLQGVLPCWRQKRRRMGRKKKEGERRRKGYQGMQGPEVLPASLSSSLPLQRTNNRMCTDRGEPVKNKNLW